MIISYFIDHIIYGFCFTSVGLCFGYFAGKKIANAKRDIENLMEHLKWYNETILKKKAGI